MRRWFLAITVLLLGLHGSALTQAQTPPQEDLQALAEILGRPGMQEWLRAQAAAPAAPVAPPAEAATVPAADGPISDLEAAQARADAMMVSHVDRMRAFLHRLQRAAPHVPGEIARGLGTLKAEVDSVGAGSVAVLLLAFLALGIGLEKLFWWLTTGFRQRMIANPLTTVSDRLRAAALRTLYGLGLQAAFLTGAVGAFLLFDWPGLLRFVVVSGLIVAAVIRLVLVFGRIILAPGAPRFRLLPMADSAARFWFIWTALLIGWFTFVNRLLAAFEAMGVGVGAIWVVGLALGLILLGLALIALWRHPERISGIVPSRSGSLVTWLLSAYLVAVWLLLLTGSVAPFYVGVLLLILPIAIRCCDLSVANLLRPAGAALDEAPPPPSLIATAIERGLRLLILAVGAALIAQVLGLDLGHYTMQGDTLLTKVVRGVLNAILIILIADFAWQMIRTYIDKTMLNASAADGPSEGEEARRRARLRTLLPILRNVLMIVLGVMALLMALSAMGLEIGPLIAGAGVVGVAIGFGAQTLVKDFISGFFYLLDDAFRVGEYIVSGSYKGTVESFSLRSVKLRHHRGPLYTVPFGTLGAIQNMSRDWVIDKIAVRVAYDTDLAKVKRLVKTVGKELMADPEFAPDILETLKMQGVDEFGDYAMVVRMKMMTKPGKQFTIRRRAYAMIRTTFAENDIKIATPTVSVTGNDANAPAAAARQVITPTGLPAD